MAIRKTAETFDQAAMIWDLNRLYVDLGTVKGLPLTAEDRVNLRGILCGYSPAQLAEKRLKSRSSLESDLYDTIYPYVKSLVKKSGQKVRNWKQLAEWLDEAGYKKVATTSKGGLAIPIDSSTSLVQINEVTHSIQPDGNIKVTVDANIRLVASLSKELFKDLQKTLTPIVAKAIEPKKRKG